MKTLTLFLLPFLVLSQTNFSDANIQAARGNDYEWLLTNVDNFQTHSAIQDFTWSKSHIQPIFKDCGSNCTRGDINIKPFTDSKESKFSYEVIVEADPTKKDFDRITKKVIFRGDYRRLVEFFTEFWSRTINFDDIHPGEVASTRFLTDIAVFSFDQNGNPQIVVESTKDRK